MGSRKEKVVPVVPLGSGEELIVGIDPGTTNTKCARVDGTGRSAPIQCGGKPFYFPSVLAMVDGQDLWGSQAMSYRTVSPHTFFSEFKRQLPAIDENGNPIVLGTNPVTGKDLTAADLTGISLRFTKEKIEAERQAKIRQVTVTVPAYFNSFARRQTLLACEIADLANVRLLDEPVAAAIGYRSEQEFEGIVGVYDLGGGTFDVSLVRAEGKVLRVLGTKGDAELGGTDFDSAMYEYVVERFVKRHGYTPDPVSDLADIYEVKAKVTQARHDLSETDSTVIPVRFLTYQENVPFTRALLDSLTHSIVEKTIEIFLETLSEASLSLDEIDRVLLVGGASRMPCIEATLSKALGLPVFAMVDREFAVSKGAAIDAVNAAKESPDLSLASVARFLPAPEIITVKKTAHPLCIEVVDEHNPRGERGVCHVMIPAQSDLPAFVERTFTPQADNQSSVKVVICQGEEGVGVPLGAAKKEYALPLNPVLPRAQRRNSVLVRYSMDREAMIHVYAKDLLGGAEISDDVSLVSGGASAFS